MNLGEIEGSLYDQLGFPTTPDSSTIRKFRRYINTTQREILGKRGLSRLRRGILTFTSTANSPLAVLPQSCVHISIIADRTNRTVLDQISLQDMRFRDPGVASLSSNPDAYVVVNMASPVALDPSAAAALYVISDSAADGTGISASIEGTITGGYYRKASVAMNGLTAVAVDTSTAWEHITKFYVSSGAAGNITLRQTSGVGTELARITLGRTYARYTLLYLCPTPASAITYYCDCELHIEDMTAPKDEPYLPEDFHWLLESGALRREYEKREKGTQWKIEEDRYRQGLADLKLWVNRTGGVSIGGQRTGVPRRFSQLGSNYPPGS